MARFDLSTRSVSGTSAEPAVEIRTTSADRPRLMELNMLLVSAAASVFGLGVPAAIGITPSGPVSMLGEDPLDTPSSVQLATAWTTKPTIPTQFFRRFGLQAAIGAGLLYAFPKGLVIAQSSGLVLWNIGTTALLDVSAAIGE